MDKRAYKELLRATLSQEQLNEIYNDLDSFCSSAIDEFQLEKVSQFDKEQIALHLSAAITQGLRASSGHVEAIKSELSILMDIIESSDHSISEMILERLINDYQLDI